MLRNALNANAQKDVQKTSNNFLFLTLKKGCLRQPFFYAKIILMILIISKNNNQIIVNKTIRCFAIHRAASASIHGFLQES